MNVKEYLATTTKKLSDAGIGTARLDALVLLEDVSGRDRAWLLAHPEHKLSPSEIAKLEKLLSQRAEHYPLAYVRNKTEFYGREFVITPAVLEPRPESETMIDCLKRLSGLPKGVRIADVGAGSGAIGITAQLELPDTQVELLEIDAEAIKVAQINVDKYTIRIPVTRSDLLTMTGQDNNVLLCNLPYVPEGYQLNPPAMREPAIAIFGGPDGLDVYRALFIQVKKLKNKPLFILTESLPPQHSDLAHIASLADYRLSVTDDFIQVFELSP